MLVFAVRCLVSLLRLSMSLTFWLILLWSLAVVLLRKVASNMGLGRADSGENGQGLPKLVHDGLLSYQLYSIGHCFS